jgi:hypothetical protein
VKWDWDRPKNSPDFVAFFKSGDVYFINIYKPIDNIFLGHPNGCPRKKWSLKVDENYQQQFCFEDIERLYKAGLLFIEHYGGQTSLLYRRFLMKILK